MASKTTKNANPKSSLPSPPLSPASSPKLNSTGSAIQGKNILNDMDIIQCEEGYIFNP